MNPDIMNTIEAVATFIGPTENLIQNNNILTFNMTNFIEITKNKNITQITAFKYNNGNNTEWLHHPNISTRQSIATYLDPLTINNAKIISEQQMPTSTFSWFYDLCSTGIKNIFINPFISLKNYVSRFFWDLPAPPAFDIKKDLPGIIEVNINEPDQGSSSNSSGTQKQERVFLHNSIAEEITDNVLVVEDQLFDQMLDNDIIIAEEQSLIEQPLAAHKNDIESVIDQDQLTDEKVIKSLENFIDQLDPNILFNSVNNLWLTIKNNFDLKARFLDRIIRFSNDNHHMNALSLVEIPPRHSDNPLQEIYHNSAGREVINLTIKNKYIDGFVMFETLSEENKEILLNNFLACVDREVTTNVEIKTTQQYKDAVDIIKTFIILTRQDAYMPSLSEIEKVIYLINEKNNYPLFPQKNSKISSYITDKYIMATNLIWYDSFSNKVLSEFQIRANGVLRLISREVTNNKEIRATKEFKNAFMRLGTHFEVFQAKTEELMQLYMSFNSKEISKMVAQIGGTNIDSYFPKKASKPFFDLTKI